MYRELLKNELQEGNLVLVKAYANSTPRFVIFQVVSIEENHINVKNYEVDDDKVLAKDFDFVLPLILTEDRLALLKLQDDEDKELDYNPEWKLYEFNGTKLAFNGVAMYPFNKEYDDLHGLMVKTKEPMMKYIHQIQNLLKI